MAALGNKARLGSFIFDFNPESVNWGYKVNTRSWDTFGGRVVQVLSCSIEDMTIEGWLPGKHNDKYARMREFEKFIIDAIEKQYETDKPLVFSYAPRCWNAKVFIKGYPQVVYDKETVCPRFSLQLWVDEGLDTLKRTSQTAELKRIADGIMWERNKYNDPLTVGMEADWKLSFDRLKQQFAQAGLSNLADELDAAANTPAIKPKATHEPQMFGDTALTNTPVSRSVDTNETTTPVGDSGFGFDPDTGLCVPSH